MLGMSFPHLVCPNENKATAVHIFSLRPSVISLNLIYTLHIYRHREEEKRGKLQNFISEKVISKLVTVYVILQPDLRVQTCLGAFRVSANGSSPQQL